MPQCIKVIRPHAMNMTKRCQPRGCSVNVANGSWLITGLSHAKENPSKILCINNTYRRYRPKFIRMKKYVYHQFRGVIRGTHCHTNHNSMRILLGIIHFSCMQIWTFEVPMPFIRDIYTRPLLKSSLLNWINWSIDYSLTRVYNRFF